jgi:hypothetical protein
MGGPVVAPDLQASLDRAVAQIPSGQRGQVTASATTTGLEIGAAWRVRASVTVRGYAERLWGGRGWRAAAQAQWVW